MFGCESLRLRKVSFLKSSTADESDADFGRQELERGKFAQAHVVREPNHSHATLPQDLFQRNRPAPTYLPGARFGIGCEAPPGVFTPVLFID